MPIPTNLNVSGISYNGTNIPLANTDTGKITEIQTVNVSSENGVQVSINSAWFNTYDYVIMSPDLTFSENDWYYAQKDSTTGGTYIYQATPGIDGKYPFVLYNSPVTSNIVGIQFGTFNTSTGGVSSLIDIQSYVYFHLYASQKKMTGTITVYGINL